MPTSFLSTIVGVTLLGIFVASSMYFMERRLFAWYFPPTSSMLPSSPVVLGKGEQYFANLIGGLLNEKITICVGGAFRKRRDFCIVGQAPLWKRTVVTLLTTTIQVGLFLSPVVLIAILAFLGDTFFLNGSDS